VRAHPLLGLPFFLSWAFVLAASWRAWPSQTLCVSGALTILQEQVGLPLEHERVTPLARCCSLQGAQGET
jgi:hypothetical protein